MGLYDIDSATLTEMNTALTEYPAGQEPWNKNLDGFNIEERETDTITYISDHKRWHGIYRNIPEAKTAFDVGTDWIISRRLIADDKTKLLIKRINGNGKDTFRQILKNIKLTSKYNGDAFAEKVKDKAGRLINLIPLDPETIRTVANRKGRIIRYEQVFFKPDDKEKKNAIILHTWQPNDLFHIMNGRVADEIHGIPVTESMIPLIKSKHQIQMAYAVTLFRYMKPTYFFEANTDDETELATIQGKIDRASKNFENVVLAKGTLDEIKQAKVAQFSILDPIPWMNFLKRYFTQVTRVPDVVQGESRESAISSGELNFISFKESVIQEQNEYSEQIEAQLGLEIKFEEPREISIENTESGGTQRNDGQKQHRNTQTNNINNN